MRLMKILVEALNSQDWDTFNKHHADNVVVRWPGGQQSPTIGRDAHKKEGEYFFKAFPDNHTENNPFKTLFGQGDWTCSIAVFTGTHKGPLMGLDGKTIILPTNKTFRVDICTVARWNNDGEIVEEDIFYDQVGVMKQLGLM